MVPATVLLCFCTRSPIGSGMTLERVGMTMGQVKDDYGTGPGMTVNFPYGAFLVLIPALDLDVVDGHCAEGADEGCRKTGIRDERNVEVDCCAADVVAVGEFLV